MKGKEFCLYFFVTSRSFKLGVTKNLKQRLENVGSEIDKVIDFKESFYFESTQSAANALETLLKNKYTSCLSESDVYKTEIFSIDCLDTMVSDIYKFHELFNLEPSKRMLLEKYIAIYDDNEKIKIQLTKNVKRMYDTFKGKEEYFEKLFKEEETTNEWIRKNINKFRSCWNGR